MRLTWDDLHLVLTISQQRGLAVAARRLGVDHSTVYRRLGALETRLGASLFERRPGGYATTALGAELLGAAERMAQEAAALDLRLSAGAARLSGMLRITAPDDMAEQLLLPVVAAFCTEQPEVEIELFIDNRRLDLSRREADIAVRATSRPPPGLVGRRVGRVASAVYGRPELGGRPLASLAWIGWEEGAAPHSLAAWFAQHLPELRPQVRLASMAGQASAAAAGLGAALFPCFLGDARPELVRLAPPQPEAATELWLLSHGEIRRRPAVRLFLDRLYQALRAQRSTLDPPES